MSQIINVWQIEFNGYKVILKNWEDLLGEMESIVSDASLNDPHEITITRIEMLEAEVDALPEHEGY